MQATKITAVANTAAPLMALDGGRTGAAVQNPLASPIWLSRDPLCPMASPSIRIPAVNSRGDVGELVFDGPSYEAWYYQTSVSGDFTLVTW